jgi:rRNA maturation RNase YbeY
MISINLVFVSAKKIRELNKKYRGIDRATSVLTFDYGPAFAGAMAGKQAGIPLGEIIICPSEAKKQGLSWEKLIIHGIKSLLSEIPTTKIF